MVQNKGKILIKKWIVIFPDFFFIFPNFENKIRKKKSEISEFLEKTKNEKKGMPWTQKSKWYLGFDKSLDWIRKIRTMIHDTMFEKYADSDEAVYYSFL